MNKWIRGSLLLALIFLPTGCSTMLGKKNMLKPKVRLEQVEVQSASLTGAQLVFLVNVANPNPYPLEVKDLKYNLEVSGKGLATGEIPGRTRVDANASTVIHVPIPMNFADIYSSLSQLLGSGSTPYRLRGSAKVGWLTIPFDEAGEFEFKNGQLKKERK